MEDKKKQILIVEDEPEWQEILESSLVEAGYEVYKAVSCSEAQQELQERDFDLVTIDINLETTSEEPEEEGGGMKLLEYIYENYEEVSCLMMTGFGTLDVQKDALMKYRVVDFIEKDKYDPDKLPLTVEAAVLYTEAVRLRKRKKWGEALRKLEELEKVLEKAKEKYPDFSFSAAKDVEGKIKESINPVTRLSTGKLIEEQLRLLMRKDGWAVLYIGLKDFGPYNEVYGFVAGDDVLRFTAMVVGEAVDELGTPDDFIGHTAANDFVVITTAGQAQTIKEKVTDRFATEVGTFYNFKHREQGCITVQDSDGQEKQVPLMTLAVGVIAQDDGPFADIREITERAAEARREDR